jgi:hypothetical protein
MKAIKSTSTRPSSARVAVVRAASDPSTNAVKKTLKSLNITKSKLSAEGTATRNVDGVVFSLTYDAATDTVKAADRVNRLEYEAVIDPKTTLISIVLESAGAHISTSSWNSPHCSKSPGPVSTPPSLLSV